MFAKTLLRAVHSGITRGDNAQVCQVLFTGATGRVTGALALALFGRDLPNTSCKCRTHFVVYILLHMQAAHLGYRCRSCGLPNVWYLQAAIMRVLFWPTIRWQPVLHVKSMVRAPVLAVSAVQL